MCLHSKRWRNILGYFCHIMFVTKHSQLAEEKVICVCTCSFILGWTGNLVSNNWRIMWEVTGIFHNRDVELQKPYLLFLQMLKMMKKDVWLSAICVHINHCLWAPSFFMNIWKIYQERDANIHNNVLLTGRICLLHLNYGTHITHQLMWKKLAKRLWLICN